MKQGYREDIDGLRAIAVLAVVLNHMGLAYFSGGYVGVDIFFVISGFLITGIIAREIQEDNFTLTRFYERRIRRILPALVGMVIVTLLISSVIYDSERFMAFGKSLIATMLFYSNINFWQEAGYFDAPSLLKPLLHTWSLAVEEQFYIVFPLLMYLINLAAKKSIKLILSLIALLSLGLSIYTVNILGNDPTSAFYLAHMRAWELLVGGLLALNVFPIISVKSVNTVLGLIGVLMIGYSIIKYTESTPFPGLSAMIPVLGTAFIIYSGMASKSLIGRALSISPLVFIGKISYSLYLWHWPLIIFAKYYLIRPMTGTELFTIFLVILGISTLSWRFIETPFRSKNFLSTKQIYAFAASVVVVILAAASTVYVFNGFPNAENSIFAAKDLHKEQANFTECVYAGIDSNFCSIGAASKSPSFIMWGDSHAGTLRKAVNLVANDNGFSGEFIFKSACPPLLSIAQDSTPVNIPCSKYNESMIQYLETHPEINTVILAARWSAYTESFSYSQKEDSVVAPAETFTNTAQVAFVKLGLERMIQTLLKMNRKVVIVSPIPEVGYDVSSANFIATRTGRDINEIIAPSLNEYFNRNRKIFAILNELKGKYDFQIVDPWKILCTEKICRVAVNGVPLYLDYHHLSLFGSEFISSAFVPVFASMSN